MSSENIASNSTGENGEIQPIKTDQPASLAFILGVVAFVIIINIIYEIVFWYYVYQHEEYQEKCEKTRNLSKRLKELKEQQMYGGGDKKNERQNSKMIKVQMDNFTNYHKELAAVSIFVFILPFLFFIVQNTTNLGNRIVHDGHISIFVLLSRRPCMWQIAV